MIATKKTEPLTAAEKRERIERYIAHANGSESFHRHTMSGLVYTDGVKYIAETAGAYWLIDAVASYQTGKGNKLMRDPMLCDFQIWRLTTDLAKKTATLTCQADTNTPAAVRQVIEYTDFPLPELKLHCERGGHYNAAGQFVPCMTLMLPSER